MSGCLAEIAIDHPGLRTVPGFENARFEDPYSGGIGNSIRFVGMAPRDDALKVDGVDNLFCAGEKAGLLVGHGDRSDRFGYWPARMLRGGAFKPRSSPYSFQGLGKQGLELLVGRFGQLATGAFLLVQMLRGKPGIAGATLFLGAGLVVWGLGSGGGQLVAAGMLLAASGLGLSFGGLHARAERGAAGLVQTVVELFDLVLRLGSNVVSFARLAAFGIAHAALADLVWQGTTSQWSLGGVGLLTATVLFAVGNALTFALEGLVAGIQALRLEYYELFSRVFQDEGRPFVPWHLRVEDTPRVEEAVA